MESEENLIKETKNLDQNISVENYSSQENPPQNPIQKQNESNSFFNPKNNQIISSEQTQSLINIALKDLQLSREKLEKELEELSKKKLQIEKELKSSFSGQSDAIARKVKGFQDYLTGAFQDLAQAAEKLELIKEPILVKPSPLDKKEIEQKAENIESIYPISDTFQPDEALIRECLEQFLGQPDFYAEPWKLRRSLEKKDIDILDDWFFNMGGRGAFPSRGSRAKNVLLSAGLISILGELYGERFQTLVLASQPERLGEWRRGLQDALGLGREDFGPQSGIVLFERSDGLVERADRLEENEEVPLILIDASERNIEIPVLQFPLWMAFAAEPKELYGDEEYL